MGRAAHAGWLPHALPAQGVRGGMQRADPQRNAMQCNATAYAHITHDRPRTNGHSTHNAGAERSPFVGLRARAAVVHTSASAFSHPRFRIRVGVRHQPIGHGEA